VAEGSPAHAAGLRSGMRLAGAVGATPGLDPRRQLFEVLSKGETAGVLARGEADEPVRTFEVTPERSDEITRTLLGISPAMNLVAAIRDNADLGALGIEEQDLVLALNGQPLLESGNLTRSLLSGVETQEPLAVRVRRGERTVDLEGPVLDRERALRLASDVAIGQDVEGTRIVVTEGWAAHEAGIRDGDVVRRVDGQEVRTWGEINELVKAAGQEGRALLFDVARYADHDLAAAPTELELVAAPREEALSLNYGISVRKAEYVFRADGPLDALHVGLLCSWRLVEDTWLTLKGMVSGSVSSKNIGGIITIGRMSYSWSEQGLAKLFFFLCMLSINLAILNVLPIPVLDGGHLMFLLIEKVKGSPPSDRFLGYSQMVGLVLILSLLVYVPYNDLLRAFPRLFQG
jgi:regulator of sigma E protease